MATQQEEETVLRVPQIVEELNQTMRSGITRTKEWRMQQLRAVLKLLQDNEERITKALAKDLGKSAHEGYLTEVKFPLDFKKIHQPLDLNLGKINEESEKKREGENLKQLVCKFVHKCNKRSFKISHY
jgi:acyl-CoA reductase-like NAD-dependent aldehyde dehydrogenase